MIDTSFIDLIKEENIDKINIDKSLIESFKLAMIKIQEYFNKKNYFNGTKYVEFFNEFLLKNSERKLKIIVSNQLKEGVAGSYSSNSCSLEVNKDYINSNTNVLAHIICHEFIHFITHHKNDILFGDKWAGETFVDEGFTEQLAREIIPVEIEYYGPIPNLIDYQAQK